MPVRGGAPIPTPTADDFFRYFVRLSRRHPERRQHAQVQRRSTAAHAARRPGSPDRDYYVQAAERLGGNRACLALARKLLKRCYHTLRELGDDALAPPAAGSGAARRASSTSTSRAKGAANHERADALAA